MTGLDSSHTAAPQTARRQGAGPARVPVRSAAAAAGLEGLMASPPESNTASHGETVYDPFAGSGTT
jgi:hypothetical protein